MDRWYLLFKQSGMTQSKFSAAIGASQGNVGDWVRGRSHPSGAKLIEIAKLFNVSVDYLLGKTDEKRPAAETGDEPSPMFDGLPLTKDETRLLSQYRSLNRQGKEYILQTLDMAVNVYKKEVSVSDVEAADVG